MPATGLLMAAICLVSWPSAPLAHSLVAKALQALGSNLEITTSLPPDLSGVRVVQWSSYDSIDHELTHHSARKVLSSCYTYRKALIRKHFLSKSLRSYIAKRPATPLKAAFPVTYELELSFADELDEMFTDELWELGQALGESGSWWILKPGMADQGMGIRLFNSKDLLQQIFEEFDGSDSFGDESENSDHVPTSVITSQLRHFVIQEYIFNPLLLDPLDSGAITAPILHEPLGRKFHLRVYCIASGALQVYLYDRVLALFAPSPYREPRSEIGEDGKHIPPNLDCHLTNTSLQDNPKDDVVRLLSELIGCKVLSGPVSGEGETFTQEHVNGIMDQIVVVLGETFKASLQNPVHFQPVPNAFELYGVDFVVAHLQTPSSDSTRYQVKLLEINAEPAIEKTGARLNWVLEDLFSSMGMVCVRPFLENSGCNIDGEWRLGDTRHNFIKCLDEEVRTCRQ